jgi:hypothetical protein
VKAQLTAAFRRLCLGTTHEIEWFGWWLSAENRTPARHSLRTDTVWLGHVLGRLTLAVLGAIFWVQLLLRAPYLIYGAPIAWFGSAWQMSDWSATPPPRGAAAESDIDARRRAARARGVYDPNGVMCVYHPPADSEPEEVTKR